MDSHLAVGCCCDTGILAGLIERVISLPAPRDRNKLQSETYQEWKMLTLKRSRARTQEGVEEA